MSGPTLRPRDDRETGRHTRRSQRPGNQGAMPARAVPPTSAGMSLLAEAPEVDVDEGRSLTCEQCQVEVTAPGLWHCSDCGEYWPPADETCRNCGAPHMGPRMMSSRPDLLAEAEQQPAGIQSPDLARLDRLFAERRAENYSFLNSVHALWMKALRATVPENPGAVADSEIWQQGLRPDDIAAVSTAPSVHSAPWRRFAEWADRVADALDERAREESSRRTSRG